MRTDTLLFCMMENGRSFIKKDGWDREELITVMLVFCC
jgi:hypothetical protein